MEVKIKFIYRLLRDNMEAIIWLTALIILAFSAPWNQHHSLCIFNNLGFKYCPGCGLGHSISYFFRGDIVTSFNTHPLGIPAVGMLLFRSVHLLNKSLKKYKLNIKK